MRYGSSKFLESSEFFFVPKDAQCSETDFLVNEFFLLRFLFFETWSILYSTFLVDCLTWRFFLTWFRNANQWCPRTRWLGSFNPQASMGAVGSEVHHKNGGFKGRFMGLYFEDKINHISKTKNLVKFFFIGFRILHNFLKQKSNFTSFERGGYTCR